MAEDQKKIRVGVVGVGSLGQWHARIYSEMSDVELAGVYDADRKRAKEIAARYHATAFKTMEELADATEALNIVVPTDKHRAVAGMMIEKGRHVLVEKPIASSTKEAEELVALAQEHGVILQVGHVERFNPVLNVVNPSKHKPHYIEALRIAPYPPPRFGLLPRGTEVSVILDLMIHDLEIILHLVQSKVVDIRAVGVPVLSKSEDISNVRLRFENGCIANVTASRISTETQRKIRMRKRTFPSIRANPLRWSFAPSWTASGTDPRPWSVGNMPPRPSSSQLPSAKASARARLDDEEGHDCGRRTIRRSACRAPDP